MKMLITRVNQFMDFTEGCWWAKAIIIILFGTFIGLVFGYCATRTHL